MKPEAAIHPSACGGAIVTAAGTRPGQITGFTISQALAVFAGVACVS